MYKNLMVNVNVCMSVFYVPHSRVSDVLLKYGRASQGGGHPQILDRIRIIMKHLGYRKRSSIKAFGPNTARKTIFQCNELRGKVSVEQYSQQSKQ